MILIDTNVLTYLLIAGDHTAAAQELRRRDSDWRSEALILVEFSNVLASSLAFRGMRLAVAQQLLRQAMRVMENNLARVSHPQALAVAAGFEITAYDARFVTLAQQTGLTLVTEDRQLRTAAPKFTESIEEALAQL
jgi:predicted nucleic acid-binding protein